MKKSVVAAAAALAALVGGVSIAVASGEQATVNYSVKGKFSTKSYKPAQLKFGVNVSAPNPPNVSILPMKVADMKFPAKKTMTFMPKKGLPVCKASATQLSVAPAKAYAVCGKSAIGMGLATFQLGQSNAPGQFREGTVVVFYGGKVGKDVKIRFSAWSDQTNAGVYAEGVLKANGSMKIAMPRLTADSSVTSLQLEIPGRAVSGTYGGEGGYSLKKGLDSGFVRVKCKQNSALKFGSNFELGSRDASGNATGGTTKLSAKSSTKCGK